MKVNIHKDRYGIQICVGSGDGIRCIDVHSVEDVADIVNECTKWLRVAQQKEKWESPVNNTQHTIPAEALREIAAQMRELASELNENGFVPIYPKTLNEWARQLMPC